MHAFVYIVSHQRLGAEDFGQSCQATHLHVYGFVLDLGGFMNPGRSLSTPMAESYPGAPADVSRRGLHEILLWVNVLNCE